MLFDAGSCVPTPGCGGGGNAIGEEAVDDAGQKISQVLSIAGDGNDLVPMRLVCNEGIDAVVGIYEPGNNPEAKLLLCEGVEASARLYGKGIGRSPLSAGSKHRSRFDTVLRNMHIGCAARSPSRRRRCPPSRRRAPPDGPPKRFPAGEFPRS